MAATAGEPGGAAALRPGAGFLLAAVLVLTIRIASPPVERAADDPALVPVRVPLAELGRRGPPDVLIVGDSRVGSVRARDFAATYARAAAGGSLPRVRVWSSGGGSIPDMLADLEAASVRPRVLVVGASPLSMALVRFTRAFRSGEELSTLRLWRRRLGSELKRTLVGFLPEDGGPTAAADAIGRRLRIERRSAATGEPGSRPQAGSQAEGYRLAFGDEPVPSEPTVQATIAALRRFQAAGSSVVLVRLPISQEVRGVEDGWGAAAVLARIAREAGIPLVDVNALPAYAELRASLLDGSHVHGDGPAKRLSEEMGLRVREVVGSSEPALQGVAVTP